MIKPLLSGKPQRGFTMIEVLISILVLAIGLLGVAGVQLVSMQQTVNSTLRSEATMYAQTVAERLRSNGGATLSTAQMDSLKAQMLADLGAGADLKVTMNGTATSAEVEVTWVERDSLNSAAADGLVTQTLTVDARL
ncbi:MULTISPECIES: type IV pilus modification protein PilV [unclassified Marinobacter]|uniref:type IV pilus modification protein PilV n=1 Tax=unclassified Marinobacter TaxID=83889 RepID=UPI0026E19F2A|nr:MULTISPECIES: type IV pilus modification protein PilV [unclassified Marinobacter]MDO6443952.1 type IV pilus modification protein PilV [Marinobacter sp. 2_MG-2023]MDO6825159.1 type IV pilus modification protein PilV [Marinobacter sp. 1_MG-2023]